MQSVFLHILPLLLGAAVSPVAAVGMIAVLTSKDSPRLKGLVYLLGATFPLIVAGFVIAFFFNKVPTPNTTKPIGSWIDIIAGIVLLGLAVKNFLHHTTKKPKAKQKVQHTLGYSKTFFLGIGLMLTNFTTLIVFIPAAKDIAISSLDSMQKLAVLGVSLIVVMSLIALPLVIDFVFPRGSNELLERLRDWMLSHNKSIERIVLIVFGIYLLIKGFGVFA